MAEIIKIADFAPCVVLFHGRGMISTLIRWQTRGNYSHAALLMPDGQIVESWQGAGVRTKKLSDWQGIDLYQVTNMSAGQWAVAINFALGQVGKQYDYLGVLRFVSRRNAKRDDRWFCSELVFAALEKAHVNVFERIEPWAVSPSLLAISPRLKLVQ